MLQAATFSRSQAGTVIATCMVATYMVVASRIDISPTPMATLSAGWVPSAGDALPHAAHAAVNSDVSRGDTSSA